MTKLSIKTVRVEGFKGADREVDLSKPSLFIGPMGSGKTTLLQSIQFAINGGTVNGMTAEAAAKFGGPNGFAVHVTLSDGFAWTRRLSIDPVTSAISTSINIEGDSRTKTRELDVLVKERVGDFAPAFNISNFLGLSQDKRRDYVLSLSAGKTKESVDADMLVNEIIGQFFRAELGPATVEIIGLASDESRLTLYKKMPEDKRDILMVLKDGLRAELVGDPINAIKCALDWASTQRKRAKVSRDDGQKAGRKLSQQKNEIEVVASTLEALIEKQKTISKRALEIEKQLSEQEGKRESIKTLQDQLASFNSQPVTQAGLDAVLANAKSSLSQSLDTATSKLSESQAEYARLDALPDSSVAQIEASILELQGQKANLELDSKTKTSLINIARKQIEDIKVSPWTAAKKMAAELRTIYCDSDKDPTGLLYELFDYIDDQSESGCIESIEKSITLWAGEVKRNEIKVSNLCNVMNGVAENKTAELKRVEDMRMKHSALFVSIPRIEDAIERIKRDIHQALNTHKTAVENLRGQEKLASQTATKLNELVGVGYTENNELQTELVACNGGIDAIDVLINSKRRYDVLAEQYLQCIAKVEHEGLLYDVAMQIEAAIKKVRETMMSALVAPLLNKIIAFVSAAFDGTRIAYCDLLNIKGKPDLEFGWVVNGDHKVSLDTMSGGERSIFCAGLIYALVTLTATPLKLLILEAETIDYESTKMLIVALNVNSDAVSNILLATNLNIMDPEAYLGSLNGLVQWNIYEMKQSQTYDSMCLA